MPEQLTFDLPSQPALGRGDFFVSPGNAMAVQTMLGWQDWVQGKLVLVGPEGAGKTHLVHVWAALCDAQIVAAAELPGADIAALASGPVAVEDADAIAGLPEAETALFHLHNLGLAAGQPLLVTGKTAPARWGFGLPDLASRMQGTGLVALEAPDDTLLTAVMAKLFNDRQLSVAPDVLDYLLKRIDRSFAGAGRVVRALDRAALSEKRRITRPLAGEVLDKMRRDGP